MASSILIATDSDDVFVRVDAALGGTADVARVSSGNEVRRAVQDLEPDLVVIDLQIGNMGGMATCMDLRLEAGAGRLPEQRILMLLDRPADNFLARHAGADGWVIKPIDSMRLRRAARELLAGNRFEDAVTMA
ncbi:MAG: response regulator transcription factor [Actinobacteria bacterium]|nr:response regulator transcription factor [Actinomycetota bacterium]